MKTTTYICDKCKKSVSEDDLCSLTVTLQTNIAGTSRFGTKTKPVDLCKNCLISKGILVERPEGESVAEVEAKNAKTLESKLIDILEDLGVVFEE